MMAEDQPIGGDKGGGYRKITQKELKNVLDRHWLWLDSERKNGERANLRGVDLYRVNLSGAELSEADLSAAYLSEANLSGAYLSGANLKGSNLGGADLSNARLDSANMNQANLDHAQVLNADLGGAKLAGAVLFGADFRGAVLHGADLVGADLRGILLDDADLSAADLRSIIYAATDLVGAVVQDTLVTSEQAEFIRFAVGPKEMEYQESDKYTYGRLSPGIRTLLGAKVANPEPMTVYVDPGTATAEEIADILSDISILYRKMGGSGINFSLQGIHIIEEEGA